jgi:Dolichyl-phosphate-mannose-protein mannosyltransferase
MVFLALAVRIAVSLALYTDQLPANKNHWVFGWEMGQIAASVVSGHGYGNPLPVESGPTAVVLPLYPLLIAGVFKLFGTFTAAAAIVMLILNSAFAAATVIPVYKIARRVLDEDSAVVAGWMWTIFPFSIFFAASEIWELSLSALLSSLVFLYALKLRESLKLRDWLVWALLWGVLGMTSAVMLATLPFLGLWVLAGHWKGGRRPILQASVASVLFLACLMPWTVRNDQTFHRFVPMRDNLWLEVHRAYNGDTLDVTSDSFDPAHSAIERKQWLELGETRYFDLKKQESIAYITRHPGTSISLFARHILLFWTGFWSLSPRFLALEPMHIPAVALTSVFTLLALAGWRAAWRKDRGHGLVPFGIVCLVYPLIYYVTHPSLEYRLALDPLIVIVGSYGVVSAWKGRARVRQQGLPVTYTEDVSASVVP